MKNNNIFYCYNSRLKDFIKSMGVDYIQKGFNYKSKCVYYEFPKSKELDFIIKKWNLIK